MGFERPYDLEGLREDADIAIVATHEDIVGPGADAVEIIALATSALKQTLFAGGSTDIEG